VHEYQSLINPRPQHQCAQPGDDSDLARCGPAAQIRLLIDAIVHQAFLVIGRANRIQKPVAILRQKHQVINGQAAPARLFGIQAEVNRIQPGLPLQPGRQLDGPNLLDSLARRQLHVGAQAHIHQRCAAGPAGFELHPCPAQPHGGRKPRQHPEPLPLCRIQEGCIQRPAGNLRLGIPRPGEGLVGPVAEGAAAGRCAAVAGVLALQHMLEGHA